jgi:hypothetical protein
MICRRSPLTARNLRQFAGRFVGTKKAKGNKLILRSNFQFREDTPSAIISLGTDLCGELALRKREEFEASWRRPLHRETRSHLAFPHPHPHPQHSDDRSCRNFNAFFLQIAKPLFLFSITLFERLAGIGIPRTGVGVRNWLAIVE